MKDQQESESNHSLLCEDCRRSHNAKECWWCRNCAKSVCKSCNLLKGHTEHRSAPWQENDVLRSCALLLEARCSRRTRQAAEEEIAIKEFMADVENRLIAKVHRGLEEENEVDRRRIATICSALGLGMRTYHMSGSSGAMATSNSPTDDHVDRVVVAASKLLKSAQLRETMQALQLQPVSGERNSFKVLPEDVSVEEFTKILEENLLSRSQIRKGVSSSDNGFYSQESDLHTGPLLNNLSNSFNMSAPFSKPNISTSTPLEQQEQQFRFPLEPKVNISNDPLPESVADSTEGRGKSETSSLLMERFNDSVDSRGSSRLAMDRFSLNDSYEQDGNIPEISGRCSVNLMVTEDTQTNGMGLLTNGTQTDERTPTPTADMDSADGTPAHNKAPTDILSFYFGSDFLTRPIDVCSLPGDKLAVSDSCGGVYITTCSGEVVGHVPTKGASASSLCFCTNKKLLFVSVMKKDGRQVNVYNAEEDLNLVESIPSPKEPKVDLSRTRWLAVSKRDCELFMVSGDNRISALWKYNSLQQSWIVVKKAWKSRFQYLEVTEERPESSSVVLLTCEGMSGALLLFVVGRNGKVWAEYNLCATFHLASYIRSPASAVVDRKGNLLILDYVNGKLWVLLDGGLGVRKLKILWEVGAQETLGLAAVKDWCYIACFNKKRVLAIKYLGAGNEVLSTSE